MFYTKDKELTVPQVAQILECDNTYIYKCVRDHRIKTAMTDPYKIKFDEVLTYVDSKIPSNFKSYYKAV